VLQRLKVLDLSERRAGAERRIGREISGCCHGMIMVPVG
jgi:hypothetical protein